MPVLDLDLGQHPDPQIDLLLATLDYATFKWRQELGEVPDEMLVWQPYPGGHNIGAIILHIADVESYWLQEVGAGHPQSDEELQRLMSKETQQYEGIWPTPPNHPIQWFFDQQDQIRARTKELLAPITDPTRVAEDYRGRELTLRRILAHVIQHEAYHGGQAALISVMFEKQRG